MTQTRRQFISTAAATAGGITFLSYVASAAAHSGDEFQTPGGVVSVHPVAHASFVMQTRMGVIYADPVGEPSAYSDYPAADLILVTHEHGDHFNVDTLAALTNANTKLITNPAVYVKLPGEMQAKASQLANLEGMMFKNLEVEAIGAYNITEERKNFHPEGRDNGYVLGFDGFRVYISGDTEDVPEMRGLANIDLAFVCMNLPFTMDVEAAASAVADFKPTYVYPYHYRGRDGGTQDPAEFAALVAGMTEVKMGAWYG